MACNKILNLSSSAKCCDFWFTRPYSESRLRRLEKKWEIPPRPKRPLNPFFKFAAHRREELMKENPQLKPTQIMEKLGEKFRSYDENYKNKLQREYIQEMNDYSRQMMLYEKSLTNEQKKTLKSLAEKRAELKEKSKERQRLKDLGKPRKPPPVISLFLSSKMDTKKDDDQYQKWISQMCKEWTLLPTKEREKYETEHKKLTEQYMNKLIVWEAEMIRLGHIDVVRRRVLLDLREKGARED
ncbi:transcription factor A, mitochondrial-like isoform X2 [Microplitis mediator]|uniref:transcription factor A, mitochondrial-like isoform X2 n=1 Tax=Microplitis mediator TaxID=375433 RepID=UPI0025556F59|nr:transcription factor A, mitochondrial-like isoform X2 [Microplitis mediator]